MTFTFRKEAGPSGLFYSALTAVALNVAACAAAAAAPVTLKVEDASVAENPSTHQLMLDITVRPASRSALRSFSEAHIGRKFVLRIDGKAPITSVVGKPMLSGSIQISGIPVDTMRAALNQISSGRSDIEIDDAPD